MRRLFLVGNRLGQRGGLPTQWQGGAVVARLVRMNTEGGWSARGVVELALPVDFSFQRGPPASGLLARFSALGTALGGGDECSSGRFVAWQASRDGA